MRTVADSGFDHGEGSGKEITESVDG